MGVTVLFPPFKCGSFITSFGNWLLPLQKQGSLLNFALYVGMIMSLSGVSIVLLFFSFLLVSSSLACFCYLLCIGGGRF